MQPKVIHNFRRRANWYGYKQVRIECVGSQNGEKVYQISALDPLSGASVSVCYPLHCFHDLLRYGKEFHRTEMLQEEVKND